MLDQSANEGWQPRGVTGREATAKVDGPHPVDGNAVGWIVRPASAGTLSVAATWEGQRPVDLALMLSLLGALACLGLVLYGWRLHRLAGAPRPPPYGPPRLVAGVDVAWVRSLPAAGATAVVAAICVHPIAAVPTGIAMALFTSRPRWGRLLPPAFVAIAAGSVVFLQAR